MVIIGLSKNNKGKKRLFHYDAGKIIEENPKYISPYLVGSTEYLPIVMETTKSLNGLPEMKMGSKPIDHQRYIFTDEEKKEFLSKEPNAKSLLRPYVGAWGFLRGKNRWILKLHDVEPKELRNLPETKKRIAEVKAFRLKSKDKGTRKLGETPRRYHLNVIPTKPFLVIPIHTSEKREYIPFGYLKPPFIPSNAILVIENASLELFGLLISKMHMVWIRLVGGRIKTDLRYSEGVVYNTFPIPKAGYDSLKQFADDILKIRAKYPKSALIDLYDSDVMPTDLKKAHLSLDRALEKLYRKKPFDSDNERAEFLLSKYKEMTDETSNS